MDLDLQSVLHNFLGHVIVFKPEEYQEVSVIFPNQEAMEHLLYVCHEGHFFPSKPHQYPQQAVV